ncbi:tetratricopeptide repeat protein [candidate division FCPU426 bacterium]|nr:tetratricopeptide repeat protein [candidate division FCPU426 bacterium]
MIKWIALVWLARMILLALPVPPENYYNQGNRLYGQEKYARAERVYARALEKNALFPNAHYNAGNAAYMQGKYPAAVEYYERALELNPEDEDAWYNLELARRRVAAGDKQEQPEDVMMKPALAQKNKQDPQGKKTSGRQMQPARQERSLQHKDLTLAEADYMLRQARKHERGWREQQERSVFRGASSLQRDIFTQHPEEILETMRELTRASYPFRPGSSLEKTKSVRDEIDW